MIKTEKIKILRFRKEEGRSRKVREKWEENIEEVKKYNYLGYRLQTNGGEHIKKG